MTGTIRASKDGRGGDAKCRSAKKRRDRERAREHKHFARSEALCDEEREKEVEYEEEFESVFGPWHRMPTPNDLVCEEEEKEEEARPKCRALPPAHDENPGQHRILVLKKQMRSALLEMEPSNRDPLVQVRNRQLIETLKSLEATLTTLEEGEWTSLLASEPDGAYRLSQITMLRAVRRRAAARKKKIRLLDVQRSSSVCYADTDARKWAASTAVATSIVGIFTVRRF